jgi:hypothetical protein
MSTRASPYHHYIQICSLIIISTALFSIFSHHYLKITRRIASECVRKGLGGIRAAAASKLHGRIVRELHPGEDAEDVERLRGLSTIEDGVHLDRGPGEVGLSFIGSLSWLESWKMQG